MLETFLDDSGHNTYDCVVMVNVLEHIEDDVDVLVRLQSILKPGGHILLFVPAMPFLFSQLDKIHGHYRRYTRSNLLRKIGAQSYQVKVVKYVDVLGILPWYLMNTIIGATEFNPTLVKLYDRIGVPATKFFERIINPPLGKNLMLVAERK